MNENITTKIITIPSCNQEIVLPDTTFCLGKTFRHTNKHKLNFRVENSIVENAIEENSILQLIIITIQSCNQALNHVSKKLYCMIPYFVEIKNKQTNNQKTNTHKLNCV